MKYSNTTLRELTARYKLILKKCAFLNAVILFSSFITPSAQAATTHVRYWETPTYYGTTLRDDLWNEGHITLEGHLLVSTGIRGTGGEITVATDSSIEGSRQNVTFATNTLEINEGIDLELNNMKVNSGTIQLNGKNTLDIKNNSAVSFSNQLNVDARSNVYVDASSSLTNQITNLGNIYNAGTINTNVDSATGIMNNTGILNLAGSETETPLEQANTILGTGTTNFTGNSKNIGIITQREVTNAGTLLNANTITAQVINKENASLTNTGSITDLTNSGTLLNSGTITSSLINKNSAENTGTVSGTVDNQKTMKNSGIISNSVTNQANSQFTNTGLIDGTVLNNGTFDNSGQLKNVVTNEKGGVFTSSADKFENNVINNVDSVLNLMGGTFSTALTGDGTTNINAQTTNTSATFTQTELNVNADFTNNGAVSINTLGLNANVLGTGSLTLNDENDFSQSLGTITQKEVTMLKDTTANVAQITADINNSATLTLLGGTEEALTQSNKISGEIGDLVFQGLVKNTGDITQFVTTNEGVLENEGVLNTSIRNITDAELTSNADKLLGSVQNNGTITLNGGTLISDATISGTGSTIFSGEVTNQATITQDTIINKGSLVSEAELIGSITNEEEATLKASASMIKGNVANEGNLRLFEGALTGDISITGQGKTDLFGSITNSANIQQSQVTNNGTLSNEGTIESSIINTAEASISSSADALKGSITNEGELTLTDGVLSALSPISGSGTTTFNGTITNNADIEQASLINNGELTNEGLLNAGVTNNGSITSNADKFLQAVNNSATLNLTGGTFNTSLTGNGFAVLSGPVTNNANEFNQSSLTVNEQFTNNGTVSVNTLSLNKDITGTGNLSLLGDNDFTSSSASITQGSVLNSANLKANVGQIKATLINNGSYSLNGISGVAQEYEIQNNGNLDISGNLLLHNNITGAGSVNFSEGSSLTSVFNQYTVNASTVTVSSSTPINLTLENMDILHEGNYNLINSASGINTAQFNLTNTNPVYDLLLTPNGQIQATLKPEPVLQETTGIPEPDKVHELEALLAGENTSTELGKVLAMKLSETLQQQKADLAIKAAKDVAPTPVQEVVVMAQNVNTLLSNAAVARLANVGRAGGDSSRSGGDTFVGGSTWAQGLYNHSKQSADASTDGFRANSRGVALGIDGKVNDAVTIGIGYGYLKTDANTDTHDFDINGHNFFLYGEYQPTRWYVDAILNYGFAKYKEKKEPLGIQVKAKYDVNTYSANVMTGYDFDNGFTPEVGMRYVLADQESYNDGIQRIASDKNDVLTGVAGIKYGRFMKARSLTFKPKLRLAATYDILSDNSDANVNVIGGGAYQVGTKRLHRFGVETGAGIETVFGNWNFSLDYSGGFRKDFRTHTGRLKAKYNF